MIETPFEYEKAQEELQYMEDWLARLLREEPDDPAGRKPGTGLTKASVRKMIARVREELAVWERRDARRSEPV